jgi:membrane protease YdiL (CAAX protease family)
MVDREAQMAEELEIEGVAEKSTGAGHHSRSLARVFRNRFGHWRAGWRFALYVLAVFAVGKSVSAVLKLWIANPAEASFSSWHHSLLWVVAALAMIAAAVALLRWVDRRPPALLGLGFGPGWSTETGTGLAGGVVLTGTLVAALLLTGSVSLRLTPDVASSLASMPRYLFIFAAAASVEELVFRGYPLQVLAEGSRRWIAGLLLCLVFTWAHASNPDVTVIGIANVFFAAIVLTALYFQTRRLWLPIAFHMSWNFAQSWLWGFDVSGITIEDRLLVVAPSGADLLTGGEFGLEGSVLTTVLFVALAAWLLAAAPFRPRPEVAAMWAAYPRGFGLPPEIEGSESGAASTAAAGSS